MMNFGMEPKIESMLEYREILCYEYIQAVGMFNDHLVDCFRYGEILRM